MSTVNQKPCANLQVTCRTTQQIAQRSHHHASGDGDLSNKGVAAILMGDDCDALIRDLTGMFPHAHLIADEAGLEDVLTLVVAFLEAPHEGLSQ
jgi:hypothetical protein